MAVLIGTIPLNTEKFFSPKPVQFKTVKTLEIEKRRVAAPPGLLKKPIVACKCEDGDGQHYHCRICSIVCESKNLLKEHEQCWCLEARAYHLFGEKEVEVTVEVETQIPVAWETTGYSAEFTGPEFSKPEVQHKAEELVVPVATAIEKPVVSAAEVVREFTQPPVKQGVQPRCFSVPVEAPKQPTTDVFKTPAFLAQMEKEARRKEGMVPKKVKGHWGYVKMSHAQKRRENKRLKEQADREKFLRMPPTPVYWVSIAGGSMPSQVDHQCKWPLHTTSSQVKPKTFPKHVMDSSSLHSLVRAVRNIAIKKKMSIEVVCKKTKKFAFVQYKNRNYLQAFVKHMNWRYQQRDYEHTAFSKSLLGSLIPKTFQKACVDAGEFEKGSSGLVVPRACLRGNISSSRNHIFVIRGRQDGRLIDAQIKIPMSQIFHVDYYTSNAGILFWQNYERTFLDNRPAWIDHKCSPDLHIEACGTITALITQAIHPCGRITCAKCAQVNSLLDSVDLTEKILPRIVECENEIKTKYPQFCGLLEFVKRQRNMLETMNVNFDEFKEIRLTFGDRKDAPYSHLNALNEYVIKGAGVSRADVRNASKNLLELARYLKNRKGFARMGSLESFRNKVSSKTHINPILMCDNQLDKNGNFLWGQREYHAKRFFKNYFDFVDAERGYDKHIIRVNPNGTRKLAIGNLIISTNLETLREQLNGEHVGHVPLTNECVSRRNGDFVYPCSCVTLEDGTPVESDFKPPTKSHLVLGNVGDAKYIDLPANDTGKMYIVRDGYCYINIFLAMLVNVDEGDAKAYTKMVRDVVVPKLGKWPMMLDVATACYMLTVFFPGTQNAELPRILVDHHAKIFHVVDSFGSKSVGYHILKANTVSQLIGFASNAVESELKYYRVGGDAQNLSDEQSRMKLLIKGIFRPCLMQTILEDDPYLLLLSVLSPKVLIALFNSGSLERAAQEFVHRDTNLVTIVTILNRLAQKVSVASSLVSQLHIIERHAEVLHDALGEPKLTELTHAYAVTVLQRIMAKAETDKELQDSGFLTFQQATAEHVEKNYAQELEDSWAELRWFQKFYYIKESYRLRRSSMKPIFQKEIDASIVKQGTSFPALLGKLKAGAKYNLQQKVFWARRVSSECVQRAMSYMFSTFAYLIPDVFKFINVLAIMSLMLQIIATSKGMIDEHRRYKQIAATHEEEKQCKLVVAAYRRLCLRRKDEPTREEFLDFMEEEEPELMEMTMQMLEVSDPVVHQAKRPDQAYLEKIVGFVALVLMLFDPDRSDCVHRILSKVKSLIGTMDEEVVHQSLDEIKDELEEKNQTVDFELQTSETLKSLPGQTTFQDWWDRQLHGNRVIPHYRTEGRFLEFTRATAHTVANLIAHATESDFLVRGAVGSGKSTGLPFHLSQKGRVLLLEPTRPLAENVCKQLRGDPFYLSPTLRMRGLSTFGSTPVSIMTTGFAFHLLANNPAMLFEFDFIMFDECHVHDSNAIAMRSLLSEYDFKGKIIKVSATPPGREIQFDTQHPVELFIEEQLSFQSFVNNQGAKTNSDMIQHGSNILVYVASYNEVDMLSKLLLARGFKVTKVDGRTMKTGNVDIQTHGTSVKPHFLVCTNIIENGVTLDVDVVVDFGLKVVPVLDTDNRRITYQKHNVSFGERIQRLGRVGRTKPGFALRIGATEAGIAAVPQIVATEAALMCFVHGLPIMTSNVSMSFLSQVTVPQARTMANFELSPYFMANVVRFDGTMHQAIHDILKPYKLRDSEITLSKLAIPDGCTSSWMTQKEYERIGVHISMAEIGRVPFFIKDIPDSVYEKIAIAVVKHRHDAGFGKLTMHNACKVAYTLQTDFSSIQRTIKIIDFLLEQEMVKKSYFQNVTMSCSSMSSFSLASISNAIRSKYARDFTSENINKLQGVKAQLLEFHNLCKDAGYMELQEKELAEKVKEFGSLENVLHQSKDEIANALCLKGVWKKSLITRDVLILGGVLVGGFWMVYEKFKHSFSEIVHHQGFSKRQRQKLKFRNARDMKGGREVYGDDGTIEQYFGDAYVKKGKTKGTVRGMGAKKQRFVNGYGYDPSNYSFVRFVDPLTGLAIDESTYTDISLIQGDIAEERRRQIIEDMLDSQRVMQNPGIQAYFIKNGAKKALRVDLTPHNPLLVCKSGTIAGYPEMEGVFRQTGLPIHVDIEEVPKSKGVEETVGHESASLLRGMRDYNPISNVVCKITNESDGVTMTTFGVGYGPVIITNQHLFKRNNGTLTVRSRHGEFVVKNTCSLKLKPCEGRDILIIKMPKDFPPFPQKLKFRKPEANERVCMVGSNFQDKSITSMISETSVTYPRDDSTDFWLHWISTRDGDCGLPMVATRDGSLVGLHSLTSTQHTKNYYACFPDNFEAAFLRQLELLNWTSQWKYNADNVCWGPLHLQRSLPERPFKITKLFSDLTSELVTEQASEKHWLRDRLCGNLKAVAEYDGNLVTKHVVKGKCAMFDLFLREDKEAREYFTPMLGFYQKSKLNKEAYIKDLMKYSKPISIGDVETGVFEVALENVIQQMRDLGFDTCNYITDYDEVIDALNMKAAVGALYSGKKKEYFDGMTDEERYEIVMASCKRSYLGLMGIWNGSLKAELRPLEKVEMNKTRTFTAAPLDTLLAGKVCVDDFNNKFYSLHIKAPWSVGMTKFYGGWNEMLKKLPEDWVYCDADGSQFDSSLSPYLINAVLRIRLAFMEKWDIGEQMLSNLYTEIIYTPIATPDGTIVKKHKGNNSGQPSTVVDNTLMVILAMNYSFLQLGVEREKQEEVCKYFVNGDDLMIAIHPEYEHLLDKFGGLFSTLGLNYDFTSRTRNKSELWFMSHMGLKRENIFIPKLERERIVSILEWDRSILAEHRLEAICAALVESWGYPDLTHQIRRFYAWLLEQAPYNELAAMGKAPYIAETALKRLYTNEEPERGQVEEYLRSMVSVTLVADDDDEVYHQSGEEESIDAGSLSQQRPGNRGKEIDAGSSSQGKEIREPDVNVGTQGKFSVPKAKILHTKLRLPKVLGKTILNPHHLLQYEPEQTDISNTRATQEQFQTWYEGVKNDYDVNDSEMEILMNGLMVWCIENGTSPNINGMWVMMDGETQVSYPIKPLIDHAKPTFRQIMAHFSDVAEAYIEMRNMKRPYMPRYGLQRNLTDMSLARYAFDFYEMTSKTPARAREAHLQMKAAALRNAKSRLFGLDGNVGSGEEDTERHTVEDPNRNLHNLMGVRGM